MGVSLQRHSFFIPMSFRGFLCAAIGAQGHEVLIEIRGPDPENINKAEELFKTRRLFVGTNRVAP